MLDDEASVSTVAYLLGSLVFRQRLSVGAQAIAVRRRTLALDAAHAGFFPFRLATLFMASAPAMLNLLGDSGGCAWLAACLI